MQLQALKNFKLVTYFLNNIGDFLLHSLVMSQLRQKLQVKRKISRD